MSSRGGHGTSKLGHGGPNMTPMVDVVMCILIFFMLSATFAIPELYLTTNTPAIDKKGLSNTQVTEPTPAVRNFITLKRLGDQTVATAFNTPTADLVTLSGDPTSTASLPDLLRVKGQMLSKDSQIIIAPDINVPWKDVVAVYDACIGARLEHVAFAPIRQQ